MNIRVIDFSNEAASKTKGDYLRDRIEKNIVNIDTIVVDFKGVNKFSYPFFNNSFAALAVKYGFDKIGCIKLINISQVGIDTYNMSMDNAKTLCNNENLLYSR